MKKLVSIASALLLTAMPLSAVADPGHSKPKITVFKFPQPPLKSGINETLEVVAHDPDSWISEIQVQWEDADHNGGVLFANTGCVQDPDYSDPGTVAKLTIPVYFDHPGEYHVEVRALSEIKCQGGNHPQFSRTLQTDVVVTAPLQSFDDPDDASGAFDIASVEQTQESSETSASTEVVHRVTMIDPWTNDALAGTAYIELGFDLDGDTSTFERVLTIDVDEGDGTLRASMLDPNTGQGRGYAAVSRPDDKTVEVSFPPLLLKKGLKNYRWYAYVDGGAPELCAPDNPCTDRAPDEGSYRHRL
jgi:hypothetical protein